MARLLLQLPEEASASPDRNSALIISGVSWTPEPSHLHTGKHNLEKASNKRINSVTGAYGLSTGAARSSGGPVRAGSAVSGSISVL